MAKQRLTLDVVWQTNAKQAMGTMKDDLEKVKRDFESAPLTIDLEVVGTEKARQDIAKMRKQAEKEAAEAQKALINQEEALEKLRKRMPRLRRQDKKDELQAEIASAEKALSRLTHEFNTARHYADQLNASYNTTVKTLESLARAQKHMRSEDRLAPIDKRLLSIREGIAIKAKQVGEAVSNHELWSPNAAGRLRGYGTRQLNNLNKIEQELLDMADKGLISKSQLEGYQSLLGSSRQQAQSLRTKASATTRIRPAKGMADEFITRQQVLRSGNRVIRDTLVDITEDSDAAASQARLRSVVESAREQKAILEERVSKLKNNATGTKQRNQLLGQIQKLDQIADDAERAIERIPKLIEEKAKHAAHTLTMAERQAAAREFFSDRSGLLRQIQSTTDKEELLKLRDQLGYHHSYVGKDFNTNEFNHEYHNLQRALQDRMNKLGVKDPMSLKERLFGSQSPYGRLYGSAFNRMNHLITNVAQMNGLSLYGMGSIGLATAFTRNTVEAAAEREATQLGFAGASNKFLTFTDPATGKAVSRPENLRRSLQYSTYLYDRMREMSKDTGVTTQELAENFSTGYARLAGKGFDPTQIAQIVSRVVQLGRLQGLPSVAIASDIRDFAAGQVNSKSQVLSAIGLKGETLKEFYKKGDNQGAFKYFQDQLQPFEGALSLYRNSIAGQKNALQVEYEKTAQIIGGKLAPTLIPLLTKLQEAVTKWAESGAGETFVSSMSELANGFITITTKFVQYVAPFISTVEGLLINGLLATITVFAAKLAAQQALLANPALGIVSLIALLVTGLADQQRRLEKITENSLSKTVNLTDGSSESLAKIQDMSLSYSTSNISGGTLEFNRLKEKAETDLRAAKLTPNAIAGLKQLTPEERNRFISAKSNLPEGFFGKLGAVVRIHQDDIFDAVSKRGFDGFLDYLTRLTETGGVGYPLVRVMEQQKEMFEPLLKMNPQQMAETFTFLQGYRDLDSDKRGSIDPALSFLMNIEDMRTRYNKAKVEADKKAKKGGYPTTDPRYRESLAQGMYGYFVNTDTDLGDTKPKTGSMPPLDVRQTPLAALAEQYYANKISRTQTQMDLLPPHDAGRIGAGYKILEAQYGQASANYVSQLTSLAGDPNAMKAATLEFTNRLEQASASFAALVREVYKASRAIAAQVEVQRLQTQLSRQQLEVAKAEARLGGPGSPGFLARVDNLHALRMDALATTNLINTTQLNSEAELNAINGKSYSEMLKGLNLSKYDAKNINLVGVEVAAKLAESMIPSGIANVISSNSSLGKAGRVSDQAAARAAKQAELPPLNPLGGGTNIAETSTPVLSGPIGSGGAYIPSGDTVITGTRPRHDIEAEANAMGIPPALLLAMAVNPDRFKGIVDPATLKQIAQKREQLILSAQQQAFELARSKASAYSQEYAFSTSISDTISGNAIQRMSSLMTNPEYAAVYGQYGNEIDKLTSREATLGTGRSFYQEQKALSLANGDFTDFFSNSAMEFAYDQQIQKTRQRIAQINVLTQQAQAAVDAANNLVINNINRSAQVAGDIAMRQYDQAMSGQAEGVMGRFNNRITDFKTKYDANTQFGVDLITATMKKQGKSETEISMAIARFQESRVAGKVDALRNAGFDTNDAARAMRDNALASVLSNSNGIASAFRGGIPTGEAMLSLAQPYTEILGNDFAKYMDTLVEQKAFGRRKTIAASTAAGSYLGGQMFAGVDPMFSSIGSQLTQTSSFFTKAFGDYSGIIGGILGAGIGSLFGGRRRDPRDEQHKRNLEELLGKIEKNTDPRRDMFDIRPNDGAASAWYSQRAINPLGYQFGMGGL